MMPSQRRALTEALTVWAIAILAMSLLYHFRVIPFIADNLMLFTSGLLLYLPVLIMWRRQESFDFFERDGWALWNSVKWTLIVSLLIFPPFLVLNHFYQMIPVKIKFMGTGFWKLAAHYEPVASHRPLLKIFFFHLILVALPEEFFFRGYLLKRFREVFDDQIRFLGVRTGKAFFLTALFFAASHSLITVKWWHFAIFFPALIFGWLREKTNGLVAPILFHALCNTFSAWVGMHYQWVR
jgi:CAAX protease family protein